eukprot:2292862-Prymnesium_polylepis.1
MAGGALLHQGGRRRGRRPCRGLHARARRRASCGGGGRRLGRPAGAVVPARAAQAEAARRAVASCWRVRRRAAATWAPRLFVWCARHTAEGKGGARVGVHSSARGEDTCQWGCDCTVHTFRVSGEGGSREVCARDRRAACTRPHARPGPRMSDLDCVAVEYGTLTRGVCGSVGVGIAIGSGVY